jgi:hypothetical protein
VQFSVLRCLACVHGVRCLIKDDFSGLDCPPNEQMVSKETVKFVDGDTGGLIGLSVLTFPVTECRGLWVLIPHTISSLRTETRTKELLPRGPVKRSLQTSTAAPHCVS